jgi:hypothetical protein
MLVKRLPADRFLSCVQALWPGQNLGERAGDVPLQTSMIALRGWGFLITGCRPRHGQGDAPGGWIYSPPVWPGASVLRRCRRQSPGSAGTGDSFCPGLHEKVSTVWEPACQLVCSRHW